MRNITYIFSVVAIIFVLFYFMAKKRDNIIKEKFEVLDIDPPEWYKVKKYDPSDWLVAVFPDRAQPDCLPYDITDKWGSLENLNYHSQAYKFWRF